MKRMKFTELYKQKKYKQHEVCNSILGGFSISVGKQLYSNSKSIIWIKTNKLNLLIKCTVITFWNRLSWLIVCFDEYFSSCCSNSIACLVLTCTCSWNVFGFNHILTISLSQTTNVFICLLLKSQIIFFFYHWYDAFLKSKHSCLCFLSLVLRSKRKAAIRRRWDIATGKVFCCSGGSWFGRSYNIV